MGELTLAPIKRLIKRSGAKRVADSAAQELADYLETRAAQISKEAQKLATHAGRHTVMRRDIKMAKKVLKS
jgi:histone H3/H4